MSADLDTLRARIVERVNALGPDDLRVLDWLTEQLPADRLRASCEAATSRGWCSAGEKRVTVPTSSHDIARGDLLTLVRRIGRIVLGREYPERRDREAVLADEVQRRTTALAKHGGQP